MKHARRYFLKNLFVYSGVAVFFQQMISACAPSSSGTSGGGGSGADCTVNGADVSIAANHGHTAVMVSAADINAAVQKTYNLSNVGHTHTYTLTPANFADLQAGLDVTVPIDADLTGHPHPITVVCA
jgi:hypothetical protein